MKNIYLDSKVRKIINGMLEDYTSKRDYHQMEIPPLSVQKHSSYYSFLILMERKEKRGYTRKTLTPIYTKYRRGKINYFVTQRNGKFLVGGRIYKK